MGCVSVQDNPKKTGSHTNQKRISSSSNPARSEAKQTNPKDIQNDMHSSNNNK